MIGTEIEYDDPAGPQWFAWWPDTEALPGIDPNRPALDYIATGTDQDDQEIDINEFFDRIGKLFKSSNLYLVKNHNALQFRLSI